MSVDLYFVPPDESRRVLSLQAPTHVRASLFADMCRVNTLSMIMEAGSGHIGSSFSAMDMVAWLHLHELDLSGVLANQSSLYFSSKGHDAPGLYAVLIGLGLLDYSQVHALRRLGGLPGHPDVSTPHAVCNTGSLGMGVSKAKGLIQGARLEGRPLRVFVMTGDGELQEGQLWESLQGAALHGMGELTVIVDHNKMQSDTWVDKVSSLGDLPAKFRSFGWEVSRCDGHDLQSFAALLEGGREVRDRPKVIIADTIKGKGVRAMENVSLGEDELYRFHSGAPTGDVYEAAADELLAGIHARLQALGAPPLATEKATIPDRAPAAGHRLVGAYSRALVDIAASRKEIVVLDADLMLDCGLIPFRERHPDRFFECGIAEQDMVSQAGAFARRGHLPIVHSFACFLSTRPNEQIYNNATERTKVVYVGSLAGLLPSGPGHSHQSVRDIGALASTPGLTLVEPCCESEVALALEYCVEQTQGSSYLRLVSVPWDVPFTLPADYRMQLGHGVTVRQGNAAVVVGYGPILLSEAFRAAALLGGTEAMAIEVVNLPWLNAVDTEWLHGLLSRHRFVFTLDNHYVAGGQGQMLLAAIAELNLDKPVHVTRLGVRDIPLCGQNDEVLRAQGLDAQSLAETIAAVVRGTK